MNSLAKHGCFVLSLAICLGFLPGVARSTPFSFLVPAADTLSTDSLHILGLFQNDPHVDFVFFPGPTIGEGKKIVVVSRNGLTAQKQEFEYESYYFHLLLWSAHEPNGIRPAEGKLIALGNVHVPEVFVTRLKWTGWQVSVWDSSGVERSVPLEQYARARIVERKQVRKGHYIPVDYAGGRGILLPTAQQPLEVWQPRVSFTYTLPSMSVGLPYRSSVTLIAGPIPDPFIRILLLKSEIVRRPHFSWAVGVTSLISPVYGSPDDPERISDNFDRWKRTRFKTLPFTVLDGHLGPLDGTLGFQTFPGSYEAHPLLGGISRKYLLVWLASGFRVASFLKVVYEANDVLTPFSQPRRMFYFDEPPATEAFGLRLIIGHGSIEADMVKLFGLGYFPLLSLGIAY